MRRMVEPPSASGLVSVPAALAPEVEPWTRALREAAGADFRALYVYGSALTTRFDAESSDINLFVVLSELPFTRLESLAGAVRAALIGTRSIKRRVMPLILTEPQIRASADVFPAEFLDLKERRALVAGDDVLADLVVRLVNLRHQCEFELRSKLVGLRQAYLLGGAEPGLAHRLLVRDAGGLRAVLRHLPGLRGHRSPEDPAALVEDVARVYGVDPKALGAPFAARAQLKPPPEEESRAQLAAHLHSLESLVAAVDAHDAR
jgi:hypothetical protein